MTKPTTSRFLKQAVIKELQSFEYNSIPDHAEMCDLLSSAHFQPSTPDQMLLAAARPKPMSSADASSKIGETVLKEACQQFAENCMDLPASERKTEWQLLVDEASSTPSVRYRLQQLQPLLAVDRTKLWSEVGLTEEQNLPKPGLKSDPEILSLLIHYVQQPPVTASRQLRELYLEEEIHNEKLERLGNFQSIHDRNESALQPLFQVCDGRPFRLAQEMTTEHLQAPIKLPTAVGDSLIAQLVSLALNLLLIVALWPVVQLFNVLRSPYLYGLIIVLAIANMINSGSRLPQAPSRPTFNYQQQISGTPEPKTSVQPRIELIMERIDRGEDPLPPDATNVEHFLLQQPGVLDRLKQLITSRKRTKQLKEKVVERVRKRMEASDRTSAPVAPEAGKSGSSSLPELLPTKESALDLSPDIESSDSNAQRSANLINGPAGDSQ